MSLHTISVIASTEGSLKSALNSLLAVTASRNDENGMSSFSTIRPSLLRLAAEQSTEFREAPTSSQDLNSVSDETLLARITSGDLESLSDLFRRHARTVFSIGRRILRDTSEAEDLVQDVFLYVHRRSSLFDSSKGHARSWLIQVAYTQAFVRRRALKSHGFYASKVTDRPPEADPPSIQGAQHPYTVEEFFGTNGWKTIWDSLTELQKETLRLHFHEGCTFTEIAEKLGQSYVNIRHCYYRGLEKLRNFANANDLKWR
jgi:RNA polymerase sigma-70 factor (ECF subfamily)